jgi:hypothetical protein
MANEVLYTLRLDSNGAPILEKLRKETEKTTTMFDKLAAMSTKITYIGFAVKHINSLFNTVNNSIAKYTNAYEAQAQAETKLAAVMRQTIGAGNDEIESIKRLAAEQQKLGVISSGAQVAGAQELATYVSKTNSIKTLIPAINDMVAQQYGLNASQEQYTQIASMVGKVMQGQTGALSRYGYSFTKAQEKVLKFGNEQQRAAVLADVITEAVGGVNEALANTPEGKQKQIANNFGDINARVGSLIVRLKEGFNPVLEMLIEKVNRVIDVVEQKNIIPKITAGIERLTNFISENIKTIGIVVGAYLTYVATVKVVNAYNAVAALFETALWKAIKKKTKAAWESIISLNSLTLSLGAYVIVAGIGAAASRLFAAGINAVSKAIYAIPIIGWIAAGIAVVIALFKLLWDKCEGFRRLLFGVWEAAKAVFHNIGVVVKALWENIVKPYIMFWVNLFKKVFGAIWDALKWLFEGIKTAFQAIGDFFVGLWDGIVSGIMAAWEWITETIASLIGFVKDLLGSVWGWITEKFGTLGAWLYKNLLEPIKKVFSKVWDFVGGILNKIIEKFGKIVGWIKELWNKLFPKDQFKDVGTAFREGQEKGSESFRKSQAKKKKEDVGDALSVADAFGNMPTAQKTANNLSGSLDTSGKEITSGGSKPTNIYINLNKEMVGQITIHPATVTEGVGQMSDIVKHELAKILNSANAIAS